MSININEVSFKITENRWLEIHVGEAEIVTIDTWDGGVSLCGDADEIGNIIENDDGTIVFKIDDEVDRYKEILEAIRNIERRL